MRVPGADFDAYVEGHVRRLEALRRAGIVERTDGDRLLIPGDFEARAQPMMRLRAAGRAFVSSRPMISTAK